MDDSTLQAWLAAAVRRGNDDAERGAADHAALATMFEELVTILVGSGVLAPGHRKHLARAAEHARRAREPHVRLRVLVDKYTVEAADIDCASLIPLCHARCCAFSFDLSSQDLDEGRIRWELQRPYVIRHDRDGYCTHVDRQRGFGCTEYDHRPATCRSFDCREDPRVWIDYAARIPAPMPQGLNALKCGD